MSIKMDADEKAGFEVLKAFMPEDYAMDVLKLRRAGGKKAKLTERAAKILVREYQATGNVIAAVEEQINRAWTGFKAEWVKPRQGRQFHDSNNPMPKPSANYGSPKPANDEPAAANIDPERRREQAERARRLIRGAIA